MANFVITNTFTYSAIHLEKTVGEDAIQVVSRVRCVSRGEECSVTNTHHFMLNHLRNAWESCGIEDGKPAKKYFFRMKKAGKYLLTYFSNGSVFICEHKMRSV